MEIAPPLWNSIGDGRSHLSDMGRIQALVPTGPIHDLAKAIPDYLLNVNLKALTQNCIHFISPRSTLLSSLSDTHALFVIGVYLALLIGGPCLVTMRRDVTN